MNFAQRLKELREERRLSQEQLAKAIDRSRTSISGYETYDRLPDVDTLTKLAKYFDVSLDWLMGFSDIRKVSNLNSYDNLLYKEIIDVLRKRLESAELMEGDEQISPEVLKLTIEYGINAAIEILKTKKKEDLI